MKAAIRFLWFLLCGLASGCLLVFLARSDIESDTRFIFLCGAVVAAMVGGAKAMQSFLPYQREDPPVPQPPSAWAESPWLKSTGLAQEYADKRERGELRLGTLPTGYQLVLPSTRTMRHVALFGPKRSGKSSSFICTFLRDWAERGSTIVIDPDGELFEQTASDYREVYRLDLIDPTRPDYWNFFPDCKGNARLARETATVIIDSHGNRRGSGGKRVWRDIEVDTLTAILLHLPHIVEQPTPAMIGEFISSRPIDPVEGETESALTKEMNGSPDPEAGACWQKFAKATREVQGAVLIALISKCRVFSLSTTSAVSSKFAAPGSATRAPIDLGMLRKPGTAIYLSVLEAEADKYAGFLATFFRFALSVLSLRAPLGVEYAPSLFVFDDAGSIPIQGLDSMLNLALDSEVAMVLAFRSVGEICEHYGCDADAILHSIKTMVFLPGLDLRTIDVAAGFARWHTAIHWTVRRLGKRTKAEQLAEADLFSTYERALRELDRHRNAIALVGTAPPIKFMYPPFASVRPQDRSAAANKGTPYIIDLQTAEAQYKGIGPEG